MSADDYEKEFTVVEDDEDDSAVREIGERIKKARVSGGLTQQQLADLIGATQNQMWRWESGSASPSALAIVRIAKAIGISTGDILD